MFLCLRVFGFVSFRFCFFLMFVFGVFAFVRLPFCVFGKIGFLCFCVFEFVSVCLCLSPACKPSCFSAGISIFVRGATSSCCGQGLRTGQGLTTLGEVKSSVDHNFYSSQVQENWHHFAVVRGWWSANSQHRFLVMDFCTSIFYRYKY